MRFLCKLFIYWGKYHNEGFVKVLLHFWWKKAGIMLYTLCTPNFNFIQSVFHYKTTLDGSCVCLLLTPQVHRPSLLTTFFSGFHLRVYVNTVEPET